MQSFKSLYVFIFIKPLSLLCDHGQLTTHYPLLFWPAFNERNIELWHGNVWKKIFFYCLFGP